MQELTKQAITKLLKDTSRALRVADYDEISELDKIAERVAGTPTEAERRILTQPFELCGVLFYPLTIAKSLWFDEKCAELDLQGTQKDLFLFWVLSLPNTEAALTEFSEGKKAIKAMRRFCKRLFCSNADIQQIVSRCIGSKESTGTKHDDEKPVNYGAVISSLLIEYGGTPERWLYEAPIETISSLFAQLSAKADAAEDRTASASKKAVAPKPTAKIIALKEFREKVNEIRQKWSANNG